MSEGRLYKAIKSDPGLLISLILFIGGVVWQYSSIVSRIDLMNQNLNSVTSTFSSNIRDLQTTSTSNSLDIAEIKGGLSQRGINIKQSRQADTTDLLNN